MNGRTDRLAERLRERRDELGITQEHLRDLGGPSPDTVVKWEQGKIPDAPQARTLEGFDRALSWQLGSSAAVLDGGEPTPIARQSDRITAMQLRPQPNGHTVSAPGAAMDSDWCPVPRRMIQALVLDAHKLLTLSQFSEQVSVEEVQEWAARIHASATRMLALSIAAERDDEELFRLVGQLEEREEI